MENMSKWTKEIMKPEGIKYLDELGIKVEVPEYSRCVLCRGVRGLCGKSRCPILLRLYAHIKISNLIKKREIFGSAPGVFVGRVGYPKVNIGPLVPPLHGNTAELDTPELWIGKPIENIVDSRMLLVRGKVRARVSDAGKLKLAEKVQEIALASSPVDVEAKFKEIPKGTLILDDYLQPFGPSAKLLDFKITPTRWDKRIEKVYYDNDLKAGDAMMYLFQKGVLVSKIQKALSVGALGLKFQRKLVPTRWSITAVDSIISKRLIEEIKEFKEINEFRVYEFEYLGNIFEILMIPEPWSYESMEAWYPGTTWNPGKRVVIYGDFESYWGRKSYASIGGCYYAARLAVAEKLRRERRQATVIIFREIHSDYLMPVGVWLVRECVRRALQKEPARFTSLNDALQRIEKKLSIEMNRWLTTSTLLRKLFYQRKIREFLRRVSK